MKNFIYSIPLLGLLLFFMPVNNAMAQCTINDATDCECLDSSQTDCDLLPDIQVSWYGLQYVDGNGTTGPTEYAQDYNGANAGRLRISVSTPNDGVGPLTVRGIANCQEFAEYYNQNTNYTGDCGFFMCDDNVIIVPEDDLGNSLEGYYCDNSDEPAKQITFQRIYHRNSDGTMSYYDRVAGTMTYHPTHGHNHSDDWGVFTLRTIDENDPNPLNWPIVSDGAKMGFCLMDYGTCGTGTNSTYYGHCRDENRYGVDYLEVFPEFNDGTNGGTVKYNSDFPNFGLGGGSYGCSPIEQGISAGYLDLYGEWLDDQWINIEPGLCNGVYWIVGEVDRNDNYLESNEENNWTAIPVTLTQQLDGGGYNIEILVDDEVVNLCNGEVITLNSSASAATESYLWSNGATTPTIDVSETGEYSLTTSSECGEGTSQSVAVTFNPPVENPITNNITINSGESAILNATGTGNIIWQDENGENLAEGNDFISEPLYENTTFYVLNEDVLTEASELLSTGAENHEGSSDYSGGVYNGGLRFDCYESFTLNSIKVYTDYEGERTIELHDSNGNVILDLVVNPGTGNDGDIIVLDWDIPVGSNYILTTNMQMNNDNFGDNNPMFKRTTDDLPNFPYTIDNVVDISAGMYDSGEGPSFSTSYYYYFYDWKINNDWNIGGVSCFSDLVEVNVFINQEGVAGCVDDMACNYNENATFDDGSCEYAIEFYDCNGSCINDSDQDSSCDEIDNCPDLYNPMQEDFNNDGVGDACDGLAIEEDEVNLFSIFPNPATDIINVKFHNNIDNVVIQLFNNVGKLVKDIYTGNTVNNQIITLNTDKLSSGIYIISYKEKNSIIQKTFTVSK